MARLKSKLLDPLAKGGSCAPDAPTSWNQGGFLKLGPFWKDGRIRRRLSDVQFVMPQSGDSSGIRSSSQQALVIAGFAGVGKSYLCRAGAEKPRGYEHLSFEDLDSKPFSKLAGADRQSNPFFPQNYVDAICERVLAPGVLLISSHKEVYQLLTQRGVSVVLVYPDRNLKEEYLERYRERGTPGSVISYVEQNWEEWMDDLEERKCSRRVVLKSQQHFCDVVEGLLSWWYSN